MFATIWTNAISRARDRNRARARTVDYEHDQEHVDDKYLWLRPRAGGRNKRANHAKGLAGRRTFLHNSASPHGRNGACRVKIRAKSYQVTPTATGFIATDPAAEVPRLKALKALWRSAPDFPDHTK